MTGGGKPRVPCLAAGVLSPAPTLCGARVVAGVRHGIDRVGVGVRLGVGAGIGGVGGRRVVVRIRRNCNAAPQQYAHGAGG